MDIDGLEAGYAQAVEAIVDTLVAPVRRSGGRASQVNVLASAMLTPGDIDALKDWIRAFGLDPVVVPDLGDSLDGHLTDDGFSPLTYGGTTRAALEDLGRAAATLVVGPSMPSRGRFPQGQDPRRRLPFFGPAWARGVRRADRRSAHAVGTAGPRPNLSRTRPAP